jgi:hypothetical protein
MWRDVLIVCARDLAVWCDTQWNQTLVLGSLPWFVWAALLGWYLLAIYTLRDDLRNRPKQYLPLIIGAILSTSICWWLTAPWGIAAVTTAWIATAVTPTGRRWWLPGAILTTLCVVSVTVHGILIVAALPCWIAYNTIVRLWQAHLPEQNKQTPGSVSLLPVE